MSFLKTKLPQIPLWSDAVPDDTLIYIVVNGVSYRTTKATLVAGLGGGDFDPSTIDLADFLNASENPFVRQNELSMSDFLGWFFEEAQVEALEPAEGKWGLINTDARPLTLFLWKDNGNVDFDEDMNEIPVLDFLEFDLDLSAYIKQGQLINFFHNGQALEGSYNFNIQGFRFVGAEGGSGTPNIVFGFDKFSFFKLNSLLNKKISLKFPDAESITEDVEIEVPNENGTIATREWVQANVSGGAVDSVNNKTGDVVLDAEDVGAEPALGFTPENVANKTTDINGAAGTYPDTPTVKGYVDTFFEKYLISKPIGNYGTVPAGITVETVLLSIPFTGGEFENGDYMGFSIWTTKNSTAGATSIQLRVGTTGTTADPILALLQQHVIGQNSVGNSRLYLQFEDGNFINNRTRAGITAANIDLGSHITFARISLDPSASWFLTFTANHANSADDITVRSYQVSKRKSF
jgi:hypothetical protein